MKSRSALFALVLSAILGSTAESRLTLADYSRQAREKIENRIRQSLISSERAGEVTGVVTFSGADAFFIQSDVDGLKVVRGDAVRNFSVNPGDIVTVTALPTLEGGRVAVIANSCRKIGVCEMPEPIAADGERLVQTGSPDDDVNWLRVRVSGRAIGKTENGFAISVDDVPVNVIVPGMPDFLEDCDRTHPIVNVRGVAELLLDQSAILGSNRYILGVKINVASPDDIELEPDLVYLANRRDWRLMLIGFLALSTCLAALFTFVIVNFRQRRRILLDKTISAERKRMADDIHDSIEQHLVGAGMLIKLSHLKEAQDVLLLAKRELRDIIWGLKNDDMTNLTPSAMIEKIVDEQSAKGLAAFSVALPGMPAKLDAAQMRDLSLIVREAIGNAIKHGLAKDIRISSCPIGVSGWRLEIGNNGKPFDAMSAPGPSEGHFGVEGMKERARRMRAQLTLDYEDGWTVVRLEKMK